MSLWYALKYHKTQELQPFAHFAQIVQWNLCNFVHTYCGHRGIIILVKPPNTLYIFYYPHSKIPSPKKTADRKAVFFFAYKCSRISMTKSENRKE